MADSNPTVRCWAAAHSLFWDESTARGVLEREACDEQSIGGFDAKMALREFNAGRLNTTWDLVEDGGDAREACRWRDAITILCGPCRGCRG